MSVCEHARHAVAQAREEQAVSPQRGLHQGLGVARREEHLHLLAEAQRVLVPQADRAARLLPLRVAEADLGPVGRGVLHPEDDRDPVALGRELEPGAVEEAGGVDLVERAQPPGHQVAGPDRDVERAAGQPLADALVALDRHRTDRRSSSARTKGPRPRGARSPTPAAASFSRIAGRLAFVAS